MTRHQAILVTSVCSLLFFALTVSMTTPAAGQARSGKPASIAGVWESKTAQGVSTLLLNADGSGEFNGKELQWTFNQNILNLSFQGDATYMYETVLTGNSLTVKSADLKQPITFTRSGSAAAEPAKPAGGGLGAIAAGGKAASASGPEGTWQVQKPNGMFTLVLEPGGAGTFNGNPVKWTLSQGILTLRWENGDTFMYNATLTASSLKVTGGNLSAPITFERAGAAGSGGMAASGGRPRSAGAASRTASGGGNSGPVGDWEAPGPNGVIHLVLNPNGQGSFGGGAIRWSYSQNALTLIGPNGTPINYETSIQAGSMTLSGGGLDSPVTFRRSSGGGGSGSGLGGGGGGNEAVEEGEEIAGAEGAPSGAGGEGARRGAGGGVAGSWRNQQGSTLQLNPDGTAVLNGQQFRYTNDGATLTLIGSDGSMPFPYSLSGNALTVSVQGQTAVYTRTGGAGGPGGRAGGSSGGGTVPQDMVGKWCYINVSDTGQVSSSSSTCFVLNPDGTYEYSGESSSSNVYGGTGSQSFDRGTWRVSGSTVHVNSQQQGPLTYQLQKRNHPKTHDPMLCLDGQCYVTYGPKPPWPY